MINGTLNERIVTTEKLEAKAAVTVGIRQRHWLEMRAKSPRCTLIAWAQCHFET